MPFRTLRAVVQLNSKNKIIFRFPSSYSSRCGAIAPELPKLCLRGNSPRVSAAPWLCPGGRSAGHTGEVPLPKNPWTPNQRMRACLKSKMIRILIRRCWPIDRMKSIFKRKNLTCILEMLLKRKRSQYHRIPLLVDLWLMRSKMTDTLRTLQQRPSTAHKLRENVGKLGRTGQSIPAD